MSSPYVSLLEAIRAHCNLPEFPNPLPTNQLVLELEQGCTITIDFEEETSMVLLFTEIGTYQIDGEAAILSSIAQANFLWAATSGSTLSARTDIQTVYLAQQFPVNSIEGEPFVERVEEFARVAQQWKLIVEGVEKGGPEQLENPATLNDSLSEEVVTPAIAQ
jgi:hypothetical protein